MITEFSGKRITDLISVIPSKISKFDDEIHNYSFTREQSIKLKNILGFDQHRIVSNNTTASDLCEYGFRYLVDQKKFRPESIDALIFISHSPDHFVPPTSSILHGKLNLKEDCLCFDINHGCAGFIVGLQQAFMLLNNKEINRVALMNGDTLSRKTSIKDRNSYPVIGDAGSVTIIENDPLGKPLKIFTKNRGKDAMVIRIPAGGFRTPSNNKTASLHSDGDGNFRGLDNLVMDGGSVFSFVQAEVPNMIQELIELNQISMNDIDYYILHQPNKFMLEKLADKIGVPYEKMPNNIVENFGNSNSVTIPLNLTFNLSKELLGYSPNKLLLAGFGVGLTWSGLIWEMSSLKSCEILEFDDNNG